MDTDNVIWFIVTKIKDDGERAKPFRVTSEQLINLLCTSTLNKENTWVIERVNFE